MSNRVIKFRFFDTIESKYQKDGSVLLGSAGEPFSLVSNGHGYNVQYRNECIPEEFTGLKDKNGKEIYEGDILHVGYNRIGNVTVKFDKGFFNIYKYNLNYCEVIGNIHENP